ncbi:hypothetical protein T265_12864, partial [Opisthorchis viverrini]
MPPSGSMAASHRKSVKSQLEIDPFDASVMFSWTTILNNDREQQSSGANLLIGRSAVRTRLLHFDFCLDVNNLAVSQPSCFLRVTWHLGIERVLQLGDYLFIIII